MLTTDSPCDVNTMMMVNRKMLDAHKKMVESKLQMEVAHSVTCMSHPAPAPPACHGATCGQHTCPAAAPHCLVRTPLKSQGSKRFFPHLEQIPEESRNNTARSVTNKKAQVHGTHMQTMLEKAPIHALKQTLNKFHLNSLLPRIDFSNLECHNTYFWVSWG